MRSIVVDSTPGHIELSALQRAEENYRNLLVEQPDNLAMRTGLAWCLFMQALHQSGQETVIHAELRERQAEFPPRNVAMKVMTERNARVLLRDCLEQTCIVINLSANKEDNLEVMKLQTLVKLSGLTSEVELSEAQSMRRLDELTWAIKNSSITEDPLPEF
jgi:hypothetical protein